MSTPARLAAAALAIVCGFGAVQLAQRTALPAPDALVAWQARHPDVRTLTDAERQTFESLLAPLRRDDALLLLAGLAAGCAALALRPSLGRMAGHPAAAVALVGSIAVGAWQLAASGAELADAATAGQWTLGDDALAEFAGPMEPTFRQWRRSVPESHAIILVGRDQYLWNLTTWALHPRPIYPVLEEVPAGTTSDELLRYARQLDLGRSHPGRWLVDLGAVEPGTDTGLLRIDDT